MKNCEKIEFFYGDSGRVYTEITNPDKVQKIISAMQQLEKYNSGALFFIHMRAINKYGRKVESGLVWRDRRQVVIFRDGTSKKLYSILKEEGIIPDPKPPASPDFGTFFIELDPDIVANMDVSQVLSVHTISDPHPDRKRSGYCMPLFTDGLPIKDTEKIKIIYECIKNAKKVKHRNADFDNHKLVFETKRITYYLAVDWNDEIAIGDWWESIELAKYFKEWSVGKPGEKSFNSESIPPVWRSDGNML